MAVQDSIWMDSSSQAANEPSADENLEVGQKRALNLKPPLENLKQSDSGEKRLFQDFWTGTVVFEISNYSDHKDGQS